jgi:hypothetical protein
VDATSAGSTPRAATRPARWGRRCYPAQVAWLRRRLDPGTPGGLPLTAAAAVAVLLAWTFGGLTQDVLAGEGTARLDPRTHTLAVTHRNGRLTAVMANATWLGSTRLLLPLLAAATVLLLRRRNQRAALTVWAV